MFKLHTLEEEKKENPEIRHKKFKFICGDKDHLRCGLPGEIIACHFCEACMYLAGRIGDGCLKPDIKIY